LNVGVKNATGEIIVRLDAHNIYDKEYISKSVRYLKEYKADNVGGIWIMIPRTNDFFGKIITLMMSSPFGAGDATYKTASSKEKPRWVETVPYGCFKKEFLEKIGFFCEELPYSEDMELNSRIKKIGGKILLAPDIISYYNTRTNFKDFLRHTLRNGIWIIYPLKYGKILFSWRHLVPLAFVFALIFLSVLVFISPVFLKIFLLIIFLYLSVDFYFSFKIAKEEKDPRHLILLLFLFPFFHIIYGLGSIWGLIKIFKE
jgi:GT2 family glycosyltransferase